MEALRTIGMVPRLWQLVDVLRSCYSAFPTLRIAVALHC